MLHSPRLVSISILVVASALCESSSADTSEAFLVTLDSQGYPQVESSHDQPTSQDIHRVGLAFWNQGATDRCSSFSGLFELPHTEELSTAETPSTRSDSRSIGISTDQINTFELAEVQLPQVSTPVVVRGASRKNDWRLLSPYEKCRVVDGKLTFRREPTSDGGELPSSRLSLYREGNEVCQITIPNGKDRLRWSDIDSLPDKLRNGLPSGQWEVRFRSGDRRQSVGFIVEEATVSLSERHWEEECHQLFMESSSDPMFFLLAAEHYLGHRNEDGRSEPYLVKAADILDEAISEKHIECLKNLHRYVYEQFRSVKHLAPLSVTRLGPTGLSEIDDVRQNIVSGEWTSALQAIESISIDLEKTDTRARALTELYRGVVLSEAGSTRETESIDCFERSIRGLSTSGEPGDLYLAHLNYGNHLLRRAQDQLYNHSFLLASGASHPRVDAISYWCRARTEYEQAMSHVPDSDARSKAALELNQAKLYILLIDIIKSFHGANQTSEIFTNTENAAANTVRHLLSIVTTKSDQDNGDKSLDATADLLLANLAVQRRDYKAAVSNAVEAAKCYMNSVDLVGLEGAYRLLGICYRHLADDCQVGTDSVKLRRLGLQCFLLSQKLAELLQERFPPDQIGLSQAGFFARRAYVYEQIVDLLIDEHRDAEALQYVESAKARSLQDLLGTHRLRRNSSVAAARNVREILNDWPKDTCCLEYYLEVGTARLFVISDNGEVTSFSIKGAHRPEMTSSELISQVSQFLIATNFQAAKMLRRLQMRHDYDKEWQDTLFTLYSELIPDSASAKISQANTVLVIPHNVLHYLPFSALVTTRDKRKRAEDEMVQPTFFIEDHPNLLNAPSLVLWDMERRTPFAPPSEATAIGASDVLGAPHLEGVGREQAYFRSTLGTVRKLSVANSNVTKSDAFSAMLHPGLLLISSHGMSFPEKPLESSLLLNPGANDDGRLSALDIYQHPVNSNVVILSACWSGICERSPLPGDDLFGLQRAFLQSGANTVISGVWDVYDGTAPEIMGDVFKGISAGHSAAASLSSSQRNFIKKCRTTPDDVWIHPYFWGMYVAIGLN